MIPCFCLLLHLNQWMEMVLTICLIVNEPDSTSLNQWPFFVFLYEKPRYEKIMKVHFTKKSNFRSDGIKIVKTGMFHPLSHTKIRNNLEFSRNRFLTKMYKNCTHWEQNYVKDEYNKKKNNIQFPQIEN